MSGSNGNAPVEVDIDPAVFQNFADLEKEFAKVELDALRRKEFSLKPLYAKRNALFPQIPSFWPQVLMNGPQEFQSMLDETSFDTLSAVRSLTIERHRIKSETEGEPRSLRFTFEFDPNDWFEDTEVVKEFEYTENADNEGSGFLVSKPVTFKWKKRGKKNNAGLLDLAVDLYKAEEAVKLKDGKSGEDLGIVDRENLWQYEKLREKLEKLEEDEDTPVNWLDWFGYRGPVLSKQRKAEGDKKNGDGDEQDMDDDEDEGVGLDVEVFPPGEEIANALAEDLWPNVMDYFMATQQDLVEDFDGFLSGEDVDDEDDEEAPELVEEKEESRPLKRQRKA